MEQIQTIIDKNETYKSYVPIISCGSSEVVIHFKEQIRQIIITDKNTPWINFAITNEDIEVFKIIKELGANLK